VALPAAGELPSGWIDDGRMTPLTKFVVAEQKDVDRLVQVAQHALVVKDAATLVAIVLEHGGEINRGLVSLDGLAFRPHGTVQVLSGMAAADACAAGSP
jgi:hypothetical protein